MTLLYLYYNILIGFIKYKISFEAMYFLSLESVADIARKILYKDILDDY